MISISSWCRCRRHFLLRWVFSKQHFSAKWCASDDWWLWCHYAVAFFVMCRNISMRPCRLIDRFLLSANIIWFLDFLWLRAITPMMMMWCADDDAWCRCRQPAVNIFLGRAVARPIIDWFFSIIFSRTLSQTLMCFPSRRRWWWWYDEATLPIKMIIFIITLHVLMWWRCITMPIDYADEATTLSADGQADVDYDAVATYRHKHFDEIISSRRHFQTLRCRKHYVRRLSCDIVIIWHYFSDVRLSMPSRCWCQNTPMYIDDDYVTLMYFRWWCYFWWLFHFAEMPEDYWKWCRFDGDCADVAIISP